MSTPIFSLKSCPKGFTRDLDKVVAPEETCHNVRAKLQALDLDIVSEIRRVDVGRLGIPVYMSICGRDAKAVLPTRKQMGKGSSPAQAEASALMELMERFAYFSFWQDPSNFTLLTWQEAQGRFGKNCIDIEEILRSVEDDLTQEQCARLLSTVQWKFAETVHLPSEEPCWLPLDWFRLLNEFNGTSSGNTNEESILQGLCELIERHVCARIDAQRPTLPTVTVHTDDDSVLRELLAAFEREGITLILKDFSLKMPLPTIGALAYDPKTFPQKSEIVVTAGTASSAAKAAIRAVTEVAQLAGDFCTNACYEASGLPKFTSLDEITWLIDGPQKPLAEIEGLCCQDIREEILLALARLAPLSAYVVQTTNPLLNIPAHYTIIPGLHFRERDKNQSVGLFVGRKLVEEQPIDIARAGLNVLREIKPTAHYLPFFQGMLALRNENYKEAQEEFAKAVPLQPETQSKAMAHFYEGYALTMQSNWKLAKAPLEEAVSLCPEMKEYVNLLGVTCFKLKDYAAAQAHFEACLRLDKGSAIDLANLGLCEKELGQKSVAQQHLEAALSLDPSIAFARKALDALL